MSLAAIDTPAGFQACADVSKYMICRSSKTSSFKKEYQAKALRCDWKDIHSIGDPSAAYNFDSSTRRLASQAPEPCTRCIIRRTMEQISVPWSFLVVLFSLVLATSSEIYDCQEKRQD